MWTAKSLVDLISRLANLDGKECVFYSFIGLDLYPAIPEPMASTMMLMVAHNNININKNS